MGLFLRLHKLLSPISWAPVGKRIVPFALTAESVVETLAKGHKLPIMKQNMSKFDLMTKSKIPGLVTRLALPSIVSVLITSIYNMADTAFVGRISTQATAAVGVVFAYMAIIQAFAFFFGHGAGNFISRALGAKQEEKAEQMASLSFFSCFMCGLLFMAVGLIFMDPLLRMMGATETILPDARDYFLYIAIASPFIMTSLVLNNLMRFQGNASMAMIGILAGAIINIGLDPLFIFVFNMGVAGAGLATMISQIISWVLLFFLERQKGGVPIHIKSFKVSKELTLEIVKGGLPSLGRQGLLALSSVFLNNAAALYMASEEADSAIAAFSVASRAVNFASSIVIGFGQGFQPVCGFNYGAKRPDRVKKAFWFAIGVGSVYALGISLFGYFLAPTIVAWFRKDDPLLIDIGAEALRFTCIAFPVSAISVVTGMYLQAVNYVVPATFVSAARSGLFYVAFLFAFGALWGRTGLCLTQMASDFASCLACIPFIVYGLKRMDREIGQSSSEQIADPEV